MADNTIVFITGANTGIGFETVKSLMASPAQYTILLGSRDPAKADAAMAALKESLAMSNSTVEPINIDVCDDASIQEAAHIIQQKHGRVDVLINNAGMLRT